MLPSTPRIPLHPTGSAALLLGWNAHTEFPLVGAAKVVSHLSDEFTQFEHKKPRFWNFMNPAFGAKEVTRDRAD